MSELHALLTSEGLGLLDAAGAAVSTEDVAREVSRLRAAGHSPDLVSAVVGQARLRLRAEAKFGEFAGRMLFTRAGLEQATRREVAALHAARMRRAGIEHVYDLGCGIGGDALAFAGLGMRVTAVEADEVTAALAAYNLAVFGDQVEVRHSRAEDAAVPESPTTAVWLDPARRTAGHGETRRIRPEEYSPPLDWALALAERVPTGIKLGPAHDRESLPAGAEAQWISAGGSVVELVLWSRELARSGIRRSALVLRGDGIHELTAPSDAPDEPPRELGAFVHEPDGAVIRARLIGEVARSLGAGPLDAQIAYLTGDAERTSPFAQSFRVREALPLKVPAIDAALRAHDIGTLEIKKRGVDADPAEFRRRLSLGGERSATLILTRIGTRRLAILAERVVSSS